MTISAPESIDEKLLFENLRRGVAGTARTVIVGLNWTLVVGPNGAGMAQTPARGTAGCHGLPSPGRYAGRDLEALADLWFSDNVFEHAIAVAAVNAHWNRFDLPDNPVNGLDLIKDHGRKTVVIGRFPGLETRLANVAVVEREPRPGEFPESALETLLPGAKFVALTGSTVVNGSLPGILSLCDKATVLMIGPSTPLSPVLFDLGVDLLSGFVPVDLDNTATVISQGGAVSALRPFGRFTTIGRHHE